jgi:hypothetical protein
MFSPQGRKMAMHALKTQLISDRVEIVGAQGEWFVRVTENGDTRTASFELESFATAFAEGQRIRLGLQYIERI